MTNRRGPTDHSRPVFGTLGIAAMAAPRLVLVALSLATLAAGCGASPASPASSPSQPGASPSSSRPPATSTPRPAPTPTRGPPFAQPTKPPLTIALKRDGATDLLVTVTDPDDLLLDVVPAEGIDLVVAQRQVRGDAGVAQGRTPDTLVVLWLGTSCDQAGAVTFEGTAITIAPGPRKACDALPVAHAIRARGHHDLVAASFAVHLVSPTITP
jgi:hypothetical protein